MILRDYRDNGDIIYANANKGQINYSNFDSSNFTQVKEFTESEYSDTYSSFRIVVANYYRKFG